MPYSVSSWFQVQLENIASEPVRKFSIGTSDYSDRVIRWPRIKRTINDLRSLKIGVPLDNTDGHFNGFYTNVYTIPNTATLQIGFEHPTSGNELVTLYTGFLKNVSYKKESCELEFADNLADFENRKIGDSDVPASFSAQIPSDIAWTLCTCYGGKSDVVSTNNPDIDYSTFLTWAAVMSAESLACAAQYDGVKVIEALRGLAEVSDSAIWVEGDGKINFLKYEEGSSLDITFMNSQFQDLEIDVESQRLVNKAYVPFNFSVESDYFQSTVFAVDTASVNSFGIHEEIYKDETVWHTSSVDALVHGQRKVTLFHDPPRRFGVNLDLYGMRQKLSETIRLVDSFYDITSSDGWRLVETELDMDTGQLKMELDEAAVLVGFYLDQSYLDGTDLLL